MLRRGRAFSNFEVFFNSFNLPKNCTLRFTEEQTAYFEFQPYKNDKTTIRGWIIDINHEEVTIELKYRNFDLGVVVWSIEQAKEHIGQIDYFSNDIDE